MILCIVCFVECCSSGNRAQQFRLQDVLVLFVLLARFVCLIILPADGLVALFAYDISDDVPTGRHVSFCRLTLSNIDHRREKERFAVLAAEVAGYYIIEVCKMSLACLFVDLGQQWTDEEHDNLGC